MHTSREERDNCEMGGVNVQFYRFLIGGRRGNSARFSWRAMKTGGGKAVRGHFDIKHHSLCVI